MEEQKKDESVKTGLQIEADNVEKLPIAGAETGTSTEDELAEKDADELVHEQTTPTISEDEEQDADELVHRIPPSQSISDNTEIDPDDLVHQK